MDVMRSGIPSTGSFLVPLWGDQICRNVIASNFWEMDLPNEARL